MSNSVITIENLSKSYVIGRQRSKGDGLRHILQDAALAPWRWLRKAAGSNGANGNGSSHPSAPSSLLRAPCSEEFWALRDVNLEIKQGEVVGIIGRNGAGKSTLLKILSRITEPTAGRIHLKGRVASLLEVGTGFHPELTGRENIFLNGAILGMTRLEIKRKFDEIVAFAEIDKFLDTPVKRYSSGMYVRLAFAVAAHLEPEILIVDEVLAVGDASFQKKCLSKMQDVGKNGRTVLFVSHNMPSICRLCERAVLLSEGRVIQDGSMEKVVRGYLNSGFNTTAIREWPSASSAPSGEVARLCAVRVRGQDGQITDNVNTRQSVWLEMEYEVLRSGFVLMPHFHVCNDEGVHVFSSVDLDPAWRQRPRPKGRWLSIARIPGNLLSEGTLFVDAAVAALKPFIGQFIERQAVAFQVVDTSDGDSARGDWAGPFGGAVRPALDWTTQFSASDSFASTELDRTMSRSHKMRPAQDHQQSAIESQRATDRLQSNSNG
jgi:lipopolysaccharide transport system ATP-binding protein